MSCFLSPSILKIYSTMQKNTNLIQFPFSTLIFLYYTQGHVKRWHFLVKESSYLPNPNYHPLDHCDYKWILQDLELLPFKSLLFVPEELTVICHYKLIKESAYYHSVIVSFLPNNSKNIHPKLSKMTKCDHYQLNHSIDNSGHFALHMVLSTP